MMVASACTKSATTVFEQPHPVSQTPSSRPVPCASSTMIAEARKDKNVYTSAVSSDMAVHSFGPGVAVVTGVARETGKTSAGKTFSQAFRFTDTWVERDGRWQCVAASAMALPKK